MRPPREWPITLAYARCPRSLPGSRIRGYGGTHGIRKGYRGRFANYITPILATQGRAEFEKQGRSWFVRAI